MVAEDPPTLWRLYMQLIEIEQTFKELKHDLVWCLTNTLMKLRGHFGCRQGAMTSSGGHHARKSNAADGQKDPQIHKRICETPH